MGQSASSHNSIYSISGNQWGSKLISSGLKCAVMGAREQTSPFAWELLGKIVNVAVSQFRLQDGLNSGWPHARDEQGCAKRSGQENSVQRRP